MAEARLNYDWLVITSAIGRASLRNQVVRSTLVGLLDEPLDEGLPIKAVAGLLSRDPHIGRRAEFVAQNLGEVLAFPPIPEELLRPDLATAPRLRTKGSSLWELVQTKVGDSENYEKELERVCREVEENPGISHAERRLIARRYRWARDIRMLGLMAELYDQPPPPQPVIEEGLITYRLQSGTRIVMAAEAFGITPELFDPQAWESRVQIKDRVYEVRVDGKTYIMKERKTNRHEDSNLLDPS